MRSLLLWASTNPFLARRLPRYRFVRRATRRFMPGETLDDALRAAQELAERGIAATLTLLGENLTAAEEADAVLEHYLEVLREVSVRGLGAEISVKPTQLGLDFSRDDTHRRLARLVEASERAVWIDMESSPYVDPTLELYRALRERAPNVGVCLQAYLRRTQADLAALLPLDPSIRLVKGAYREPPDVAFPRKADVDANFLRLTRTLLQARAEGGSGRPVLGTHDLRILEEAGRMAGELGLAADAYEIAMLYGIQREAQERLAAQARSVRVLISYGEHWFPWYMRRLAERPANVWFVVRQILP